MIFLLGVVAPVFAIVALGYGAVRFKLYSASGVGGIIAFVNNFAAPCLLFRAMQRVDFRETFDPVLIAPYYIAAFTCFALGIILARVWFKRRPGESVVFGFAAFFSNTVLLGIPIINRAYGDAAMPLVFSIISIHGLILFNTGLISMEVARRDGASFGETAKRAVNSIIHNPLLWGVFLGLMVNIFALPIPEVVDTTTEMMAAAVIPAALFGLGGALNEYKVSENWQAALPVSMIKAFGLPALVYLMMVPLLGIAVEVARPAILLAAMPAGINAYIFSTFYNRATGVAANTVLFTTFGGIVSISFWLWFLGTV